MGQEGGERTGGSVWAGWGVRTSGRCLENIDCLLIYLVFSFLYIFINKWEAGGHEKELEMFR